MKAAYWLVLLSVVPTLALADPFVVSADSSSSKISANPAAKTNDLANNKPLITNTVSSAFGLGVHYGGLGVKGSLGSDRVFAHLGFGILGYATGLEFLTKTAENAVGFSVASLNLSDEADGDKSSVISVSYTAYSNGYTTPGASFGLALNLIKNADVFCGYSNSYYNRIETCDEYVPEVGFHFGYNF